MFTFIALFAEILFEPETQFRVVGVKEDTRVSGATRILVEVMDTPPVLEKVVKNFTEMCEKNAAKENMSGAKKQIKRERKKEFMKERLPELARQMQLLDISIDEVKDALEKKLQPVCNN